MPSNNNVNAVVVPGSYGSTINVSDVETVQSQRLGTEATVGGRRFVYASHSGSGIGIGSLCAVAAPVANHVSVAYASGGTAGSQTATVTLGATAATADQYKDGWFVPIDGTGQGQLRQIDTHPAADASATLELTVTDPFDTALGTGEVSLVKNEFADVVVHPGMAATTGNNAPIGVNPVVVPDGSTDTQYFWMQVGGPALVLKNGTALTDGAPVVPADGTADAGQVVVATEGAGSLDAIVGYVINEGDATSDGDHVLIRLTLG